MEVRVRVKARCKSESQSGAAKDKDHGVCCGAACVGKNMFKKMKNPKEMDAWKVCPGSVARACACACWSTVVLANFFPAVVCSWSAKMLYGSDWAIV